MWWPPKCQLVQSSNPTYRATIVKQLIAWESRFVGLYRTSSRLVFEKLMLIDVGRRHAVNTHTVHAHDSTQTHWCILSTPTADSVSVHLHFTVISYHNAEHPPDYILPSRSLLAQLVLRNTSSSIKCRVSINMKCVTNVHATVFEHDESDCRSYPPTCSSTASNQRT